MYLIRYVFNIIREQFVCITKLFKKKNNEKLVHYFLAYYILNPLL